MTYVAGNTSGVTACAKDFMETNLHPNMLTAGFTYVEEVLGPTTNTTRIYKSSLALNEVGDWYLIVNRNSDASTSVILGVCEDYDSVGHLAKKWAPLTVIAGQTLPADRSHYTTAGVAPASALMGNAAISLSSSVHPFIMSLNTKRVVISGRPSGEGGVYAGLYEPLLTGVANHFPLVVSAIVTSASATYTSFTREMGTGTTVATSSGNGSFTVNVGAGDAGGWAPLIDPMSNDPYLFKPTISRALVPGSQSKSSWRGVTYGYYVGDNAFTWGDVAQIADWDGVAVNATCVYSSTTANRQRLVDQAW